MNATSSIHIGRRTLMAAGLTIAAAVSLPAVAIESTSEQPAFNTWDFDNPVGVSTVTRNDAGLSATFQSADLPPGQAITLWFVVFNNPGDCFTSPCGLDDLVANPDAGADLLWGGNTVVGESGQAKFAGHLARGDSSRSGFRELDAADAAVGLTNPLGAEVHLMLHSHGPALEGLALREQLDSFTGGCEVFLGPGGVAAGAGDIPSAEGECTTFQVAVHESQITVQDLARNGRTCRLLGMLGVPLPTACLDESEPEAAPVLESLTDITIRPIFNTWDFDSPAGSARLLRLDSGLHANFRAAGVPAGQVMTLWFVIFNNPDGCFTTPCGLPDLVENPAAEADFLWGEGNIVDASGKLELSGHLPIGDMSRSAFVELGAPEVAPGLLAPRTAEVHLMLHSHGPVLEGETLVEQLNSFTGGCVEFLGPDGIAAGPDDIPSDDGECTTFQVSVHQ